MNAPVTGVGYFFNGFELMTKPGIKRFVIMPLLINILLFVGLFFLLRHFMHLFDVWFTALLPTWLAWVGWILWILFFLAFCLIFIYSFVTLANLIGAPFNSLLSEKVEAYLTGATVSEGSFFATVKDIPRSIGRQLSVLAYYLPRAVLCLLLFFVPVVQLIAPFIWFMFNAWFMAMTYLDYPTDNHKISFNDTLAFLKERRWSAFGFGIGVLFVTTIPILNFLVMPAAVAGATQFWVSEGGRRR